LTWSPPNRPESNGWRYARQQNRTARLSTDVNTAPGINAVATVTAFARAGNVDTVLVAGRIRNWRGKLTGHDMNVASAQALASRDYVFAASGQRADALTSVRAPL